MPQPLQPPPLPSVELLEPPYYLRNFEQLIAHALGTYRDLLEPEVRARIEAFAALPAVARMLFVRLLTRRGPWLRSDRLHYAEIGAIAPALAPLRAQGFVVDDDAPPGEQLLGLFTQAELAPLARALGLPARLDKGARCTAIVAAVPPILLRAWVRQHFRWLRVAVWPWIDTLTLLYFGNRRQDLSTFVVAELGHVRYEAIALAAHRPFADRADFEHFRAALDLRERCARVLARAARLTAPEAPAAEVPAAEAPAAALLPIDTALLDCAEAAIALPAHRLRPRRRDRLLVELATALGRRRFAYAGIAACAAASGPEAEHRRALLEQRAPAAAPSRTPAPVRARPYRPAVREFDIAWTQGQVEAQALARLELEGYRGAHLENHFAGAVFGLLCWDIVFAPVPGAFYNAFQAGPADLDDPAFRARRAAAFAERLAEIAAGDAWRERLARTWHEKAGIANPFVAWRELDAVLLHDLCGGLAAPAAAAICARIADDPRRHRVGFPDLTLRRGNGPTVFCEVKSPRDQLHPGQREWLRLLDAHLHAAWVARIREPAVAAPRTSPADSA